MLSIAGGTLKGNVIFKGKVPPPKELDILNYPNGIYCKNNPHANTNKETISLREIEIDKLKGLKNAIVAVTDIKNENWLKFFQNKPLEKVQSNLCEFIPNTGVFPHNGIFEIENLDSDLQKNEDVLHEPHLFEVFDGMSHTLFTSSIKKKGDSIEKRVQMMLANRGSVLRLQCDRHEFMQGWYLPIKNPNFTRTDKNGNFELRDIPVGRRTILVWHPILGEFKTVLDINEGEEVFAKLTFNSTTNYAWDFRRENGKRWSESAVVAAPIPEINDGDSSQPQVPKEAQLEKKLFLLEQTRERLWKERQDIQKAAIRLEIRVAQIEDEKAQLRVALDQENRSKNPNKKINGLLDDLLGIKGNQPLDSSIAKKRIRLEQLERESHALAMERVRMNEKSSYIEENLFKNNDMLAFVSGAIAEHPGSEKPPFYNVWFKEKVKKNGEEIVLQKGEKYHLLFNIGEKLEESLSQKRVNPALQIKQQDEKNPIELSIHFICLVCRENFQVKNLSFVNSENSDTLSFNVEPMIQTENSSMQIAIVYNNVQFDELNLGVQVIASPTNNLIIPEASNLTKLNNQSNKVTQSHQSQLPPLDEIRDTKKRNIFLKLLPSPYGGKFNLHLTSENLAWSPTINTNLTKDTAKVMVGHLRNLLAQIMEQKLEPRKNLTIDEVKSLKWTKEHSNAITYDLAKMGWSIFNALFPEEKDKHLWKEAVGNAREPIIHIYSGGLFIPWNFLYEKELPLLKNQFQNDGFWGYKYIADVYPIPLKRGKNKFKGSNEPHLLFASFAEENKNLVDQEESYKIHREEHVKLFNDVFGNKKWLDIREEDLFFKSIQDYNFLKILYFFTHGDDSSREYWNKNIRGEFIQEQQTNSREPLLILTPPPPSSRIAITPANITQFAQNDAQLINSPLVFLNTCESGELYSLEVDSFALSFLELGARGVIVTEEKIWGHFASKVGKTFLNNYIKEKKTGGKVLLKLRQDLLEKFLNPLGFLYSYYGDSQIVFGN